MYTPKKLALTLLLQALILLTPTEAHIQQRDHASLKRLLKKRALPDDSPMGPVAAAGAAPPSDNQATPTPSSTSASAAVTSPAAASDASTTSSSSSSSASASGGLSDILGSALGLSAILSDALSVPSTSSVAPSSTSSGIMTTTQSTSGSVPSTVTRTATDDTSETSPSLPSANASKPTSIALTVIIVVASSLAAITILWTIFRKWKLGRSGKFDERMNPINWQPTGADDEAIPGSHRRLSGASFQSGSAHGHPNSAGTGHGSDHGHGYTNHGTYGIPDHDFTAGAAHLAPVGGYADLTRGPSPQPQMQQTSHSATYNHYDANVPLHHQTGY